MNEKALPPINKPEEFISALGIILESGDLETRQAALELLGDLNGDLEESDE